MTKLEYGTGTYSAKIIGKGTILIRASGMVPTAPTKAILAELPWRIYPPHFGLFFETSGDVGATVMLPYVTTLVALYPTDESDVTIVDANGMTKVPLETVSVDGFQGVRMAANVAPGFAVYQQINVPSNCVIAPVGAIMPAIFFNATAHLGPLDYAAAQSWRAEHCGGALF
jgi:hypothetical protein